MPTFNVVLSYLSPQNQLPTVTHLRFTTSYYILAPAVAFQGPPAAGRRIPTTVAPLVLPSPLNSSQSFKLQASRL